MSKFRTMYTEKMQNKRTQSKAMLGFAGEESVCVSWPVDSLHRQQCPSLHPHREQPHPDACFLLGGHTAG